MGDWLEENPEAGYPKGLERTIGDLVTGTLTGTLPLPTGDPNANYWEDLLNHLAHPSIRPVAEVPRARSVAETCSSQQP